MTKQTLFCPYCGSDNMMITDNQPLAHSDSDTPIDTEIYVSLECQYCEKVSNTVGTITYAQPQKTSKTINLTVSVEVESGADEFKIHQIVKDALETHIGFLEHCDLNQISS